MKISARFIKSSQQAFTLVELLVVIGILGVLMTVALAAINPAEAQRKARDTQRMKDMATLQTAVEQYLADGGATPAASADSGALTTTACASNWTGLNLCNYLNKVPVDPQNNKSIAVTDGVASGVGTATTNRTAIYKLVYSAAAGTYKICTYLESKSNATKPYNDGGLAGSGLNAFDVFTDSSLGCL